VHCAPSVARLVDEIMNRELLFVRPDDRCADAARDILYLGASSAPVLDEERRLVGFVSLRDLFGAAPDKLVRDRMTAPAVTIPLGTAIVDAAHRLGEHGLHHAPVVDGAGRAVGFVSTVDLMCGLVGIPVRHPASFPHLDDALGVPFSDDAPLEAAHVERAPSAPGVLALVHGDAGLAERLVWAEAARDLQARLRGLLAGGLRAIPRLERFHEQRRLRFRCAIVADEEERREVADRLLARARRTDVE